MKPGTNIEVPLEQFDAQLEKFAAQKKVPDDARVFPEHIRYSVTVVRAVIQGLLMVLMSKSEASIKVAEDYIHNSTHSGANSRKTLPEEASLLDNFGQI